MTDASDPAYALKFKVNYTPLLANSLEPALRSIWDKSARAVVTEEFMPSVYYVTNNKQFLVFDAEWRLPAPADEDYMPLWILHEVTWIDPANAYTFTCHNHVRQAEASGLVTVNRLPVVIGASILQNSKGQLIKQAFASQKYGYYMMRLPTKSIFVGRQVYKMLQLDYSNSYGARVNKGNYAPLMNRFNALKQLPYPQNWQYYFYSFVPPPLKQLPVAVAAPTPPGPYNQQYDYSPLMNEWVVKLPGPVPSNALFGSYQDLVNTGVVAYPTTYMDYQPIVGR